MQNAGQDIMIGVTCLVRPSKAKKEERANLKRIADRTKAAFCWLCIWVLEIVIQNERSGVKLGGLLECQANKKHLQANQKVLHRLWL